MSEEPNDSTSEGDNIVDFAKAREREQQYRRQQLEESRRRGDQIVDRFNGQWCVVNDHGTVFIIQEVNNPLREGFRNIYRQTKREFQTLFLNRRHKMLVEAPTAKDAGATKTVVKSHADLWLEHPQRRTYLQAEFAPGRQLPRQVYNLWTGWGVEPIKPRRGVASCDRLLDHLYHVICWGNPLWYDYLISWLSRAAQRPGEVGQVAVVLRGGEGVGKTTFAIYLLKIFGPHALHLTNSAHLQGRYNVHLQNCIFLFSDEAYYPGDKAFEGAMRGMITEDRLPVEPKYMNLFEANNCLHMLISSNNQWVVPMAIDARRFFVLDVPDTRKGDGDYFDALIRERDHQGGPAALLWTLLNHDIRHFDVRQIPDTPAGRHQKRLSLKSIQEFWMEVLDREHAYRSRYGVRSLSHWPQSGFYTTELIWAGYCQWCSDKGLQQRQKIEELGTYLSSLYGPWSRPHVAHPTHEIAAPLAWARPDTPDPRQPEMPYHETRGPSEEGLVDNKDHLPDDVAGVVVCQRDKRGYFVGTIEEARDRFEAVMGPLDPPWRQPVE